jgi:hypothetical protein
MSRVDWMMAVPRRRRVVGATAAVALGVLGWLSFRGLEIHSELGAARAQLSAVTAALRAGDGGAAKRVVATSSRHADKAAAAANDPVWRLACAVPLFGRSFSVVRAVALTSQTVLRDVVPPGERAAQLVSQRPLLVRGRIDLTRLEAMRGPVRQASSAADAAATLLSRAPRGLVLGSIARQRLAIETQLNQLSGSLRSADAALRVAPTMLGRDGPRRYFVAVQNNAEVRGTGGNIGAYAVLKADRGVITRERVGSDRDFVSQEKPVVDLGQEYADHYDSQSGRTFWTAAILTPDWPSASQVIAGLWKAQGGGHLDGVIGVDAPAMAAILQATGPVTFDKITVTGATVADFVMSDEYSMFPAARDAQRKLLLADLAVAVYDGVIRGAGTSTGLVRALAEAGGSGHLQVWAASDQEEAVLSPLRAGGALPSGPGAFLEVVSNNASGNKADYYVRRRVAYERRSRGTARVTVTLSNLMQPDAVPALVSGRQAGVPPAPERGSTRQIVTLYCALERRITRVTVDGVLASMQTGTERGHGWASVLVEIPPSRPTTIVAEIEDPGGQLLYRQQPLVKPDQLALRVPYRLG